MEPVWDSGLAAIRAFQGMSSWLTWPMQAVTWLGLPAFYILLLPTVYWCLDARLGLRLGTYLLFSIWLRSRD